VKWKTAAWTVAIEQTSGRADSYFNPYFNPYFIT